MLEARIIPYTLQFNFDAKTSRGTMKHHQIWYLVIHEDNENFGVGEIAPLPGLSIDPLNLLEKKLHWVTENIALGEKELCSKLKNFPAIVTGIEMAFKSLESEDPFKLFPSVFTQGRAGIPTNGLIWMADAPEMQKQLDQKIAEGFKVIKLKIGALEWAEEKKIIKNLRNHYDSSELEIRVDANGSFDFEQAEEVLIDLAKLEVHSIEQPIAAGQWDDMAELIANSPVPIALDEELIGISLKKDKKKLLETLSPDYIIIKPTLLGGFAASAEWISLAKKLGIDWWVTSALESNVGLNAIAQWVITQIPRMYQGLGTGGLYTNNIPSPLELVKDKLIYSGKSDWDFDFFGIKKSD